MENCQKLTDPYLDTNTYLFIFEREADKKSAWEYGPQMIMGHDLVLKEWPPDWTL